MSEARYRIELHGEGSGLLDSFTGRSEPDCMRQLVDKLENGDWFFRMGDTLKFVSNTEGWFYIIATKGNPDERGWIQVYSYSYDSFSGNWTFLKPINNSDSYTVPVDCKKPATWKTEAGAAKAMARMAKSHVARVIMRVRIV